MAGTSRPVKAHGMHKRPAVPCRLNHAVGVADRAAEQLPVGRCGLWMSPFIKSSVSRDTFGIKRGLVKEHEVDGAGDFGGEYPVDQALVVFAFFEARGIAGYIRMRTFG